MTIAYYTMDEVNRFLVRRWAKGTGAGIICPAGRELTAAPCGVAGVILDLDSLPPAIGADRLGRLGTLRAGMPAMVHGHNISDSEATALRKRGIRVCRGRVRKSAVTHWLAAKAAQPLAAS